MAGGISMLKKKNVPQPDTLTDCSDDEDEELPDVMRKRAGIGLLKKKNALPEFKEYFSCPPLKMKMIKN